MTSKLALLSLETGRLRPTVLMALEKIDTPLRTDSHLSKKRPFAEIHPLRKFLTASTLSRERALLPSHNSGYGLGRMLQLLVYPNVLRALP